MRHELLMWAAAATVSAVVHAGIMAATAEIRIKPREDLRRAEIVLGDETLQTLTVNAQPVKPDAALDATPVARALAPAAQSPDEIRVAAAPAREAAAEAAPAALPTGVTGLDAAPAEAMAPEQDVAVLAATPPPDRPLPMPAAPQADAARQPEGLDPAAPNPLAGSGEAETLVPSGPAQPAAVEQTGQLTALTPAGSPETAPASASEPTPPAAAGRPAEPDLRASALASVAPASKPAISPLVVAPAEPADTVAVAESGDWTSLAPSESWEIAAAQPTSPDAGGAPSRDLAPLAPDAAPAVTGTEQPAVLSASLANSGTVLAETGTPVAVASNEPQTVLPSRTGGTALAPQTAGPTTAALPSGTAIAVGPPQILSGGQPAPVVGPVPTALLPATPRTAAIGTGVARVARAGALAPGGGAPAPAAPAAPSSQTLASLETAEPGGMQPASPSKRIAAITTPMVSQADRIRGFLKTYETGDCFFARPQVIDAAQPVLEGLREERQAMDAFGAAFRESVGVEPELAMRPVMDAQCPAVNFIRDVLAKSDPPFRIDLDRADIADGSFLAGHLTGEIGGRVTLLLVDDDGAVRDISSEFHSKADGTNFFFIGEIRLLAEGRLRSQLILAITTDATLDLAIAAKPGEALQVFQSIADQAAQGDMSLKAAYAVFRVK